MRPSRRALILSTAGGFALPLLPLFVLSDACSLDEFEPIPSSSSGAGAATSSSGGGDAGAHPACPPEMAELHVGTGPGFCIDRYEVTRGEYAAFLSGADAGPKPSGVCAWNTSYASALPLTPPSLPAGGVDWCDAYAYCASRSKRLCGSVKGGSVALDPTRDTLMDEWQVACSNEGTTVYPYGNSFVLGRCNDCDLDAGCAPNGLPEAGADGDAEGLHDPAAADAGSFPDCVASGVYDLSGSVWEWEDSCAETGKDDAGKRRPDLDPCSMRGGSFKAPSKQQSSSCLACSATPCGATKQARSRRYDDLGFRCCKDLD